MAIFITNGSTTTLAASATSVAKTIMTGNMDMGEGGHSACKMSMTWNWYTVGACFISNTWQVTSSSMFAASCVGVILLVMSLELLRRAQREFDAYVARKTGQDEYFASKPGIRSDQSSRKEPDRRRGITYSSLENTADTTDRKTTPKTTVTSPMLPDNLARTSSSSLSKSDLLLIHSFRAFIHTLQFGLAYFVMLLAMYYNGYFIICMLVGAYLGAFVFSWDQTLSTHRQQQADVTGCC